MRPKDEYTWEAEYWDEFIKEFGLTAYFQAREEIFENSGYVRKEDVDE